MKKRADSVKSVVALLLILALILPLAACGKSSAVKEAEAAINAIGEMDDGVENRIRKAEELVNALSEEEKGKIANLGILESAQAKSVETEIELLSLIEEKDLDYFWDKYDLLKFQMDWYDKVERHYNSLSDEQKQQIDNYDKLESNRDLYQKAHELSEQCEVRLDLENAVKEKVISKVKGKLKDPKSFDERSFLSLGLDLDQGYDEKTGKFDFTILLTYGATNSYGGVIETRLSATVKGVYVRDDIPQLSQITDFKMMEF